jgi:hypothetical protein
MLAILRALVKIAYYFTQHPEDRAEVRSWVTKTVEPTPAKTVEPTPAAIPEYPRAHNPLSILTPIPTASGAPFTAASTAPSTAASTTASTALPTSFEELPRRLQSMAKFWAIGCILVIAGMLVGSGALLLVGLLLIGIGFLHLRRKKA